MAAKRGNDGEAPGRAEPIALTIGPDAALLPPVTLRRRSSPVRRAIAASATLLSVALAAFLLLPLPAPPLLTPDAVLAATAASPATWIAISHPRHLYTLTGEPLGSLALSYEARRTADGQTRQDRLTYGQFGDGGAFLTLAVRRSGTVPVVTTDGPSPAPAPPPRHDPGSPDLLLELVRLAATHGLALTRAGMPAMLDTRLGPAAVVEVRLQQAGLVRPCLGVRVDGDTPVAALACGGEAQPPDRSALACLLGHLDLDAEQDVGPEDTCGPLVAVRSAAR